MSASVSKDRPSEIMVLSVTSGGKTNISFSIAIIHVEHLYHPLQLRKSFNCIKQIAQVTQIVVSAHFGILFTDKINQRLASAHQVNIPQIKSDIFLSVVVIGCRVFAQTPVNICYLAVNHGDNIYWHNLLGWTVTHLFHLLLTDGSLD